MSAHPPSGRRASVPTIQQLARDISRSAYEDVVGLSPRPHRKDPR